MRSPSFSKNTIIYLLGGVFAAGGNILLAPMYLRLLSAEDFGTWSKFGLMLQFLLPIMAWGLLATMARLLVDSNEEARSRKIGAALKTVGESVTKPIDYYANNIHGTISLLRAMQAADVKNLVFSSSATVYGDPQYLPIDEEHLTSACSRSGIPNKLTPYVVQVATGNLSHLNIFGNDYPKPDGTGVRDYNHVMDSAEGHLAALKFLIHQTGWYAINLGTGIGNSVLEIVKEFENASGKSVPYQTAPRRSGDIASCYAKADKASEQTGWQAKRTLEDMCASTCHWRSQRKGQSA